MVKRLAIILVVLLVSFIISIPAFAQTPDSQAIPQPLSVKETLQKWGVVNPNSPLVAPLKDWPETPEETHPDLPGKAIESPRALTIYRAGISTAQAETWAGYEVAIQGGSIANDDPSNNNVYLTPHLVLKDGSDYLAVVLKKTSTANNLELWTCHYNDLSKWSYHTTISQSGYYDFLIIIYGDRNAQIYYRTYPSGSWVLLREESMASQQSMVQYFLEHQVPTGMSLTEHGDSYWENMILFDSTGQGYWWDQTPTVIGPDYPLDELNVLYDGYDRYMWTWSQY